VVRGQAATATTQGTAQPTTQAAAQVRTIGELSVRFVGTAIVDEQVVRANMQLREGLPLTEKAMDDDLQTLNRTGLFDYVRFLQVTDVSRPNEVDLIVEVTPRYRVLAISFEGNERISDRRLEDQIRSRANLALNERQVQEDSQNIRAYYERTGFNQAIVSYEIERDRATGYGTVVFTIREGQKVKIRRINFTGNENVSTRTLRRIMDTKKWGIFSWALNTGRFQDDQFEDDVELLLAYYREQGYLDVEILRDEVRFDYPKASRLVITIPINEGRQYRVGQVSFTGNTIYPSDLLARLIRRRTGMVYVPSELDADLQTIQDYYGRDGYLDPDTYVTMRRYPNVETGDIDIEYVVDEGGQYRVESVEVEGNTVTKSIVILRELPFGPGDVFSGVDMKISKLTLENTQFFESVEVTAENTNLPGRKNLKVAVREGRTGSLQFGAGFSSLDRATIFVEFAQGNFDLFNRRSFFRGDGQKFRVSLQLGSETSQASLSFEEPWLFEQRLGLGFNLFRTSSAYDTVLYKQVNTGVNVYLRKRLIPSIGLDGRLDYTIERIDITDIDSAASAAVREQAGASYISRVNFQLTRDTRDRLINTTQGGRFEFNAGVAGGPLGGDQDYYSLEYRGSQFFPVFNAKTQVISLIGRLGVINAYGDTLNVPYYNRHFLGGPDDLRGFEYRGVGPKDFTGEPLGGSSYGFFSTEYTFDIVSGIRIALFYDAGFVNTDAYDFNPGGYNDNYGFSFRFFLAGAPVSLDYGIPLTQDAGFEVGPQFNFSFGTRY